MPFSLSKSLVVTPDNCESGAAGRPPGDAAAAAAGARAEATPSEKRQAVGGAGGGEDPRAADPAGEHAVRDSPLHMQERRWEPFPGGGIIPLPFPRSLDRSRWWLAQGCNPSHTARGGLWGWIHPLGGGGGAAWRHEVEVQGRGPQDVRAQGRGGSGGEGGSVGAQKHNS